MKSLSGHIFERTKTIPQVTSWQLTNRRVSDIWCHSRHSIFQSFSPCEFIIWFKSIQAKQVDLVMRSLFGHQPVWPHWSSLRSLLRTLWEANSYQVLCARFCYRDLLYKINRTTLQTSITMLRCTFKPAKALPLLKYPFGQSGASEMETSASCSAFSYWPIRS